MQNKEDVRGTSIGYAINLIMDYGSGRQVTISGTLPLGATLDEMNDELDKLRLATNRQAAMVTFRDVENTVAMAKKTAAMLELSIEAYEKEMQKEIDRVSESSTSKHTITKAQIEGMRSQATNHKMTKQDELLRAKSDIEKGELMLARLKEEIKTGCTPPLNS